MNIETERILRTSGMSDKLGKTYKAGDYVEILIKNYGKVRCFIKKINKNEMTVTAIDDNRHVQLDFDYKQIEDIESCSGGLNDEW